MADTALVNMESGELRQHVTNENRPITHGQCLSSSDRDRIRIFVHEFVVRALVPFIERQMRILNEQLIARKGISRSLTTGIRKWFGGSSNALSSMNNNAIV